MKTLFICDEFTLDLTGKDLNWTEENSWFHDDFILNSTFPSDLDYTDDPYFLIFKNYNDTTPITKYDGILQQSNGKVLPGYMEIEEAQQKLKFTIRAGIEAFPTWNKKLTELNLGKVNPPGGMLPYAMTIIDQTWPSVTHNFPAVQCFNLYKDDPLFAEYFHGYYNKMNVDGTGFIQNIEVPEENIYANHNIVYPMPYWMHVLQSGIQEAGYTLMGDILQDEDFNKSLMGIRKIELSERPEVMEFMMSDADYDSDPQENKKLYKLEIELEANTRYRVRGQVFDPNGTWFHLFDFKIKMNGVTYFHTDDGPGWIPFDIIIPPGPGGTLIFDLIYHVASGNVSGIWAEGEIIPTHIYDEDGELIPAIANFNNVDLAAQLPEITFGDFIKIMKAWKNYDFEPRDGKQIWMNLIENEMVHENPVDLRDHEVKFPKRKFEQQGSYLIKFSEENEEYPFTQTFVNLDGTLTGESEDEFPKDDNTKEIIINCVPLPVMPMAHIGEGDGTLTTAKLITEDVSKPWLVMYEGLNPEGKNWTQPPDDLMTPVVTERYWFKFIMFMIKSVLFSWSMNGKISEFANLTKKSIIFAYNNYMVVKQLNRKQKGKTEEIEIEARTF